MGKLFSIRHYTVTKCSIYIDDRVSFMNSDEEKLTVLNKTSIHENNGKPVNTVIVILSEIYQFKTLISLLKFFSWSTSIFYKPKDR